MIDNKLIENALALTSKKLDFLEPDYNPMGHEIVVIEKFGWYLISTEFSSAYYSVIMCNEEYIPGGEVLREHDAIAIHFLMALREYQSGDSQPLIELLSKIK